MKTPTLIFLLSLLSLGLSAQDKKEAEGQIDLYYSYLLPQEINEDAHGMQINFRGTPTNWPNNFYTGFGISYHQFYNNRESIPDIPFADYLGSRTNSNLFATYFQLGVQSNDERKLLGFLELNSGLNFSSTSTNVFFDPLNQGRGQNPQTLRTLTYVSPFVSVQSGIGIRLGEDVHFKIAAHYMQGADTRYVGSDQVSVSDKFSVNYRPQDVRLNALGFSMGVTVSLE